LTMLHHTCISVFKLITLLSGEGIVYTSRKTAS